MAQPERVDAEVDHPVLDVDGGDARVLGEPPEELPHAADAGRLGLHQPVAVAVERDDRPREVGREELVAAVRPDRGAAAGLRRAERLVEHEHARVEPELGGADLPHHAVEVRVVVEAEAARLMDEVDPAGDVGVVDPHVVGVVDHERRGPLRDGRLECCERRVAVLLERQRDDVEARRRGRRGVARVRLDRGDHLRALRELAPCAVVGAGDAGVEVGGVRSAAGLEDEAVHPGELAERLLQPGRGLYFIVQVPKRLTPIIPRVSWERCR